MYPKKSCIFRLASWSFRFVLFDYNYAQEWKSELIIHTALFWKIAQILGVPIAYSGGHCATYSGDVVPLIPEVIVPLPWVTGNLQQISDRKNNE